MNRQKLNIRLLASACMVVWSLASCQDAAWDDHYGIVDGTASASLMEELSSRSEFSDFVALLKQTGGDSILGYNQTFTVFAPTNEAMSGLNVNGNAMTEVIQNHVARYLYGPSNLVDTAYLRVKMLNGKYQELTRDGNQISFAGIKVANDPLLASNGIIYPLSTRAGYYDNIWELLSNGVERYDSLQLYCTLQRHNDGQVARGSGREQSRTEIVFPQPLDEEVRFHPSGGQPLYSFSSYKYRVERCFQEHQPIFPYLRKVDRRQNASELLQLPTFV